MINYELPKNIFIDGKTYHINKDGDFRIILDILSVLNDNNFSDEEKLTCSLIIFYNFDVPCNLEEAQMKMFDFISCGKKESHNTDKKPIMNWEKDFDLIISPINKALGYETREKKYLHWWTFFGGYMEIEKECIFSYIVNIRQKKNNGISLDKYERKYYEENREIIDLPINYTKEENEFWDNLLGGKLNGTS